MKNDRNLILSKTRVMNKLWTNCEYDFMPDKLIVNFSILDILKAKYLLKKYSNLFAIECTAYVYSDSFEGKIVGDTLHIYQSGSMYVQFLNEWSGTLYEIDISYYGSRIRLSKFFGIYNFTKNGFDRIRLLVKSFRIKILKKHLKSRTL